MELGIQNSLDGTIVYVYTDASDKDKDKLADVLALIKKKNVQIKFLLTGTCTSDRRRRKRATDWSKLSSSYETIAGSSGGEIYKTDNNGI
ncbi:hypothetical protein, partial [Salmonella sp. s51090]|uniref:hypothetical protein n=1 Tax=Salmonella sp. s51090 TaxID=3159651 RepID=UPI00397F4688